MPAGSETGHISGQAQRWTVFGDDNFNYMDESERYELGSFDSFEDAVAACRAIVDRYLEGRAEPDAALLLNCYMSFGEDPFIIGPDAGMKFSARDYARQRCNELRPQEEPQS